MIHFKPHNVHEREVAAIQKKIKKSRNQVSLASSKNPSNTLRNSDFKKGLKTINLAHLNQILSLDLENRVVEVEPKMTVRELTRALLAYNLMLPVVPEFGSITVGGAIMGTSLESASHRYGQFNDICLEYEVILGDGRVEILSKERHRELFLAQSGSYGTLALLTCVKIKLVEAKKYVRLTLKRFSSSQDLVNALQGFHTTDFVEGILFSENWGVSIKGELSDSQASVPFYDQSAHWHQWYYQYVAKKTKRRDYEMCMLLEHYLFRLDRGAFWMGRLLLNTKIMLRLLFRIGLKSLAPKVKKEAHKRKSSKGPGWLFRFLFGKTLTTKSLYKYWHRVPQKILEKLFFVQDFYTPYSQCQKILDRCMETTGIFPIWLCPLKNTLENQFLSPHLNGERLLNIGLYGVPTSHLPIPALTKQLETFLYKNGGKKMFYSFTYLDLDLFYKKYNYEAYLALRKEYHSDIFPDLYDKIVNLE